MAVTGIALIAVRGWGNITGGRHWLELGILLYVVAVVIAMAVQAPAGRRLVELTPSRPPPAPVRRRSCAPLRSGFARAAWSCRRSCS